MPVAAATYEQGLSNAGLERPAQIHPVAARPMFSELCNLERKQNTNFPESRLKMMM
jgi:hypothetical protein